MISVIPDQPDYAITKKNKVVNLQDIIIGIIDSASCPLLNYLILIGKLYLWDCRRRHVLLCIEGFKFKFKIFGIQIPNRKNTFILRIITYLHFTRHGQRIFRFKFYVVDVYFVNFPFLSLWC